MRKVLREDHEQFRATVRGFLENHVAPFHAQWEKEGVVPRSLWRKAGEAAILLAAAPAKYGGGGGDFGHSAVLIEEIARINATGLGFSMHSDVVAPYILSLGTQEQKQHWLPAMAKGETIGALAMTEPDTGSDVKAITMRARREGDHYVLDGQKTYITNGCNAGIVIVAVKTDPAKGRDGISLVCVEDGTAGFTKGRNLEKIGLHAQDTAELFFDNVRVPVANRLGEEGKGFAYLMHNLAQERLIIALRAAASAEAMLDLTIAYTKEREAFGKALFELQNTRFALADAAAKAAMLRAFVDDCLADHLRGGLTPERAAMAKLNGAELQNAILDSLLQLHGGAGYMREFTIGRAWADARVMRIYGGSSEIMKEIIARSL